MFDPSEAPKKKKRIALLAVLGAAAAVGICYWVPPIYSLSSVGGATPAFMADS